MLVISSKIFYDQFWINFYMFLSCLGNGLYIAPHKIDNDNYYEPVKWDRVSLVQFFVKMHNEKVEFSKSA